MILNDQPGLLEKIKPAVKPLTERGDFYLESISINDFESAINIKLCSPRFEITFGSTAINTQVVFSFLIPSLKKRFIGEMLSPAIGLNIPITKGVFLENFPSRPKGIIKDSEKYQTKWDVINKATGFIEKMNDLCFWIHDNLPELQEAFLPENIDDTVKAYLVELKKTFPYAKESDCEIKEWEYKK